METEAEYTAFYKGVTSQGRADSAKTEAERQKYYNDAITHYIEAIDLNPELTEAYSIRGEVWLHLKKWRKAKADLTTAKKMGVDIIESFHNDYESVEEFEAKLGVWVPKDIAALLRRA